MTNIEEEHGVHSRERTQVNRKKFKTPAEQYTEHHKLDFSLCDSDKIEDRGSGQVAVIDGKSESNSKGGK